MKKILAFLLAAMMFSLCACGNNETPSDGKNKVNDNDKASNDNIAEEEPVLRMSPEDLLDFATENLSEFAPSLASEMIFSNAYGEIQHGTYYSETLGRERNYNILLPPNYDENEKYPVVYALHGYWGDEYSLLDQGDGSIKCREVLGNLIADGKAVPMIVVFPDIFCHATKEDCDGMNDENNRAYDNFINELRDDLMPYIEANYPVATGRENTAVTGFSMGGRESLYIGIAMADKIGYVGAACPAPGVIPDCFGTEAEMVFPEDNKPYIVVISAGTNDTVVYSNPENYHNILTKNGEPHIWHLVTGGEHWGSTIRPHLYNFLQFCFKEPVE